MDITAKLAEELQIRKKQAEAAVKLIDEGNTIPFIARYRKEATGALNDEVLRSLAERLTYLRNLEEKKEQVLSSIEEQGKLTAELKTQILAAETMVVVDDLYRPYRPKRRTRAIIAREKGLQPLADLIWLQMSKTPLATEAEKYIDPEKEVNTAVKDFGSRRTVRVYVSAVLFLFSGVKTVMFFLCTVECHSIIKSVFCIRLKVIIRKSANQMKVWDAKL